MSHSKGKLFDKFKKPFRSHHRLALEGRGDQLKPPTAAATTAATGDAATGIKRSQLTRVAGSAATDAATKAGANASPATTKPTKPSGAIGAATAATATAPAGPAGAQVASPEANAAASAAAHHAGAAGIGASVGTAHEAHTSQQQPQQSLHQQPQQLLQQSQQQPLQYQQYQQQQQQQHDQQQHHHHHHNHQHQHQTLDPSKNPEHRLLPTDLQAENALTRALYGGDLVRGALPAPGASGLLLVGAAGYGKTLAAASSIPATAALTALRAPPTLPLVLSYTAGEYATTLLGNTYKQTASGDAGATTTTTPKRQSARQLGGVDGSGGVVFRQPLVKRDAALAPDEPFPDPTHLLPSHKRTHLLLAPDDAPVPANEVGAMGRQSLVKANVNTGATAGAAAGVGAAFGAAASGGHGHMRSPSSASGASGGASSAQSPPAKRRSLAKSDDSNVNPYARDPKEMIKANLEEAKRHHRSPQQQGSQLQELTTLFELRHDNDPLLDDKDPLLDVIVLVQGTKDNGEATKIAQRAVEQLKRENPNLLKMLRELRINYITGDVTDQYGQVITRVKGYGGFIELRGHPNDPINNPINPSNTSNIPANSSNVPPVDVSKYLGKTADKAGPVNAVPGMPIEAYDDQGHLKLFNDDVDHSPTPPHLDKVDDNLLNRIPARLVISLSISGGYYYKEPIQHRPLAGVADIAMSDGATKNVHAPEVAAGGNTPEAIPTEVPATGRDMGWPNAGVFVDHMMDDESRQAHEDRAMAHTPLISSIGAAAGMGTAASYSNVVVNAYHSATSGSSSTSSSSALPANISGVQRAATVSHRGSSGTETVGVNRAASHGSRPVKSLTKSPETDQQQSLKSSQPQSLAPPKHSHRRAALRDFDVDALRHGAPQETSVSRHVMNREPLNVLIPQLKLVGSNQDDYDATAVPYSGLIGVAHDVGGRPVRSLQIPPHSPRLDLGPGPHSPVPSSPVPMSPKALLLFGFNDDVDDYGNASGGHLRATLAIIGALGAAGVVGATRKPSTKRQRHADDSSSSYDNYRASDASGASMGPGHRHTSSLGLSKAIFPSSSANHGGTSGPSSTSDSSFPIAGEFAGVGRDPGPVNKHLLGAVVNPTPPVNPEMANLDDTIDQKVNSRLPPPRLNLGGDTAETAAKKHRNRNSYVVGGSAPAPVISSPNDDHNDTSRSLSRQDALAALELSQQQQPRKLLVDTEKERVLRLSSEAHHAKFVSGAILLENPATWPLGVIEPEPLPTKETPSSSFGTPRQAYRNMLGGYSDPSSSPLQALKALKGSPQAYKRASLAYEDDYAAPSLDFGGSSYRNFSNTSDYPESSLDYPRLSDFTEPTDYSEPDFARPNYSKTNYSEPSFSEPELEPEAAGDVAKLFSRDEYLPQETYPVGGAAAGAVAGGAIAGVGGAAVGAIAGAALGTKAGYNRPSRGDEGEAVVRDSSPVAYNPSTDYPKATDESIRRALPDYSRKQAPVDSQEKLIGDQPQEKLIGDQKQYGGDNVKNDHYPLESFVRGPTDDDFSTAKPQPSANDHKLFNVGYIDGSQGEPLLADGPKEHLIADEPRHRLANAPSNHLDQQPRERLIGDEPSALRIGDQPPQERVITNANDLFDKYRKLDTPDAPTNKDMTSEFGIDRGYGATGVTDDIAQSSGDRNRNVSLLLNDPGRAFGAQLGQVISKHREYVEVDNSPQSYTTPRAHLDNIDTDDISHDRGITEDLDATPVIRKLPLDELIDTYTPKVERTPSDFSVDRAKVLSQLPANVSYNSPRTTPRDSAIIRDDADEDIDDPDRRATALGGGAAAALAGTAIVGAHFGNSADGSSQQRYGEPVHELPDFDDEPQLSQEELARRRREIEKRAASAGATIKGLNENKPYTPEELAQKKAQAIKSRGYVGPRITNATKGTYIYHCEGIPVPGFWVD